MGSLARRRVRARFPRAGALHGKRCDAQGAIRDSLSKKKTVPDFFNDVIGLAEFYSEPLSSGQ